jgi:hypothetical protein
MKTVFLVDGKTRLILCMTAWGEMVREKLVSMGHKIVPTNETLEPDTRDVAELARRDALLDSTGM